MGLLLRVQISGMLCHFKMFYVQYCLIFDHLIARVHCILVTVITQHCMIVTVITQTPANNGWTKTMLSCDTL